MIDQMKYSWYDNYARSSGYVRGRTNSASVCKYSIFSILFVRIVFFYFILLHYLFKFDTFELNQEDIQLATCPLISDHANYVPDLFDLTKDEEARNYWLDCFEKTVQTVVILWSMVQ